MIVVFEFIAKNKTKFLNGDISIINIHPDNFTEILFKKDCMCINSRTSLDTYLRYSYEDWAIKFISNGIKLNMSLFDQYIQKELLKRFKVLDEPKTKTVNEELGILGN